jgi:hypothetical protein
MFYHSAGRTLPASVNAKIVSELGEFMSAIHVDGLFHTADSQDLNTMLKHAEELGDRHNVKACDEAVGAIRDSGLPLDDLQTAQLQEIQVAVRRNAIRYLLDLQVDHAKLGHVPEFTQTEASIREHANHQGVGLSKAEEALLCYLRKDTYKKAIRDLRDEVLPKKLKGDDPEQIRIVTFRIKELAEDGKIKLSRKTERAIAKALSSLGES